MNARDLIATARGLAALSPRRPRQTDLRRAVSTAYYAVFHCLASSSADLLAGRSHKSRMSPAWHRVYRALEHGQARNACKHSQAMRHFPSEIQFFANTFVILQSVRHRADYAPEDRYDKLDVLVNIDRAEDAIVQFGRASARHRRDFATHVLFRQRPS